ncbi:histidine kinase [Mucilaginibacter sp. RS28]|uniref:Histidine kinase n=1 Tax=Mucilaginibacter straminoryzae TaxID=2932774 RepID=A0A9X1X4Z4_9SPHI|nr:histidine kinase [Mucilaginibacter straminoryzae]MCJ8210651.1 histidine kinase [Mucilaginibacter straminoryzae]
MKGRDQISLYWKCQLAGWSVASLYWATQGMLDGHFILWIGSLQFVSDVVLYILITHLYHRFALRRGWQNLELRPLIGRLIPALVVLSVLYLAVTASKVYVFRLFFTHYDAGTIAGLLRNNGLPMFMAGIRLMSIWLLAHHLYYYGKRELSLAQENSRLALAAKDAEMKLALITKDAQMETLQSQLNPHFLFNALNTIKALVVDDPALARRGIDLMSELLRSSLYHNRMATHTLREEISLITDYLELEKLRLEERLQVNIAYPDELAGTTILRYSIQVLAENAVKHGISHQRSGGLLSVNVTGHQDCIEVLVRNPGTLQIAVHNEGLGLKNLNERLQLYYQGKASFHINENAGIVAASIFIPRI